MSASLRTSDHRAVAVLDSIVATWVVLWLVLGVITGLSLAQLTELTDSALASADAATTAGQALQSLRDLPVVGATPGELGDEVVAAGEDIRRSAEGARADILRVSIVLGLAVFLIPVGPALGLYLPPRIRRTRELRSIERALRRPEDEAGLDSYLARRALGAMTFDELRRITPDPGRDVDEGRYDRLAAAELERLGVDLPPRLADSGSHAMSRR